MSAPTENMAASAMCERALDYAYGELQGAEATEFEAHLKDCARCQSELQLMKRVRSAVRTVLPLVEPPQAATGALHAQLLHAAAQRRPPRTGKVLQFARRVVSHPGYAAAAGLLIIGGAIGLQFARGGLQMPATKMAEAPAPAPVEAKPEATLAAAPADQPTAAAPNDPLEGAIANTNNKDKAEKKASKESALADESAPDVYLRRAEPAPPKPAAPAHHAAAGKVAAPAPAPKSPLGLDDSGLVYDVKMGPNTGVGRVTGNGAGGAAGSSNSGGGGEWSNSLGGVATKGGSANYRDQPQAARPQATAPRTRSAAPRADSLDQALASPSPKPSSSSSTRGYAQAPEPPPQAAPSWNAPSPPAEERMQKPMAQAENEPQAQNAAPSTPAPAAAALQQPMQKSMDKTEEAPVNNLARTADGLRRKAEELASSGRCEEAVKLYHELEKTYPTFVISPRDRLPYVRCLRATGNEQLANDLEQRFDNANQQRAVQAESPAAPMPTVQSERAYKAKAKPAKKARAADDATLAPAKK